MRVAILTVAAAALATSACGGHHLADYDFRGRSVAVVQLPTPYPSIWTGDHSIDSENTLIAVIEAGSALAVELESRRARARLDSAATNVDISRRIASRALERSARYLGARPVEDRAAADFLLEIDVERFGIDASSGAAANLYVQGEVILIDAASGREVWTRDVSAWDQLTPRVGGMEGVQAAGGVLTAAALTQISVREFERILEQLADYTADVMTDELRDDLRDLRD